MLNTATLPTTEGRIEDCGHGRRSPVTCPMCLSRAEEVAYDPRSRQLVCLDLGCRWTRTLTEDQVMDLFFGEA